ncbi:zinc finger SWIM domain-containing protein 8 homolog [Anthonomus grandis grandis]|uniref:zinc finger SWIM domain-containing protein 8 homolog n=1 Tax=Anthonomus grandis grandis TaxID=2921223 RepID=UPI0021653F27|nr:zinc finger SWIM domain-containing protein 8 homolog [Anthonomus grandis grandis]XP_050312761.1 zinc finger SWIM domain-containing protein 8 homolog [Anthonomus grandis grandis]XP_050312762.1 zinc finger SWIM domain-containing protein 8 homolog [Anthonomus grandis grandis]XP_050312763.1 zinc finger SWIM domain-containing protein 8 homolog [Anthonomus grandis grandis]XP_050312764.1 zinc finger SWIM domain-containing protein 8 homolog [Anthonomus grandis grandis]XP_050312765.1 zinc finger SWI
MCSWSSEPESVCNNWRGWKKPTNNNQSGFYGGSKRSPEVPSLTELAAKCVASHIPFELVEHVYPPVPEQLQLRIAFWSFPDNEEDIRLYSCLANGSADEFSRGDNLYRNRMVQDPLQIGFHLSASVQQARYNNSPASTHNVAVTFDRRRISSCNCTCQSPAYWCSHIVAVCLTRIHLPETVTLRAPVSESLSRLHREQLQKFAQYLISELPQQILPTAQRLLDELLGSQPSAINSVCGAPDPTAGASANDQTSWYLDEKTLHDNIKKILIKFCVPAPMVFSDVNYLSTVAPPAAAEWSSLLRPLRGREPEGMWNLLSIVREMFKRNDRNAVPLLEIITEECMACEQILIWWFNTKVALLSGSSSHGGSGGGKHNNINSNTHASQHAGSSLCDEVVVLWRLAALNPGLAPSERDMLHSQFTTWHMKILEKVSKCRNTTTSSGSNYYKNASSLKADLEIFTGFKPAIEACYLDWDDYPMPGITYTSDINPMYHCPFTCFRHGPDSIRGEGQVPQVNSSKAVLNCEPVVHHHAHHRHHYHSIRNHRLGYLNVMSLNPVEYPAHPHINHLNERDGNRSSVSSEGFCEVDDDINIINPARNFNDSDSQEGGGSDSSSSSTSSSRDSNTPVALNRCGLDNALGDTPETVVVKDTVDNSCDSEACLDEKWPKFEPTTDTEEESRRQSKDESSSSESPNSGDEYCIYFYNRSHEEGNSPDKPSTSHVGALAADQTDGKSDVFSEIRKCNDPWDVLFARAEGLYAHGHGREACILGVKLAEELLANPPNLMIEVPQIPKKKGKKSYVNPATHQLSVVASGTLSKGGFLCSVLSENPEHFHLAFRVGMFGLEMARPPASTKPLEVKLANQEVELVNQLKRLPLGHKELQILRKRAEQIKDGTLKSRGEAMLPIMLASFIFDALVIPSIVGRDRSKILHLRLPTDEPLAFEAAVVALGLKANVSEADHPLLCEGTRRQRGELAISLLTFYKDDCYKICRIMDKLLDREVHQLLKTPLISSYYTNNPPIRSQFNTPRREDCDSTIAPISQFMPPTDVLPNDCNNSRPHSSTSAEVEQGVANLALNGQGSQIAQGAVSRTKDGRYKKRAYPSIPNQPSEAGAHFMFELAKTVLTKAGGTSSTSLFTQPSSTQSHHGPHRALHMCAFQLGLYALGLHNCVSPNWLSRTYSSHVSWITGQAMEIGAAAISFLIDTWEGHLTPTEAASISDRASRGCDINMVSAAANLAISVLPHSHALNPNEIQRAILQCKEQSDDMLEHACLTVESAAKGGGVYPEVLFQVAKYWYELYIRHTPGGEQLIDADLPVHDSLIDPHAQLVALIEPPVSGDGAATATPVVVTTAPPPYQHGAPPVGMYLSHYNFLPAHPTGTPMGYAGPIPSLAPAAQHVHVQYQFPYPPPQPGNQPMPPFPPPLAAPAYAALPPPTTTQQMPFPNTPTVAPQYTIQSTSQYAAPPPPPASYVNATLPSQLQQPPGAVFSSPPPSAGGGGGAPPPLQYFGPNAVPLQAPQGARGQHMFGQLPPGMAPPHPFIRPHRPQQLNQAQLRYLLTAYRVGMLAMDTLARRVHDDRPQAKYARNPPYGEDVKWLLRISKNLSTHHLHHFCVCAVNSIVSPFVLHDVAIEAAQHLSRNNPGLVMQHLRTALMPLVNKCQQMYIQCMHQKLYHLTTGDYEDFVSIVLAARAAFHITPEGNVQFKEWLSSIRRSKSCKKDLWQQINQALQSNSK